MEIEATRLKNAVVKADKVCGSLEPSNRKLSFIVDNGRLYAVASDGCLSGYFDLGPFLFQRPFAPFEVPLDILKQFLSELSGHLTLTYQDQIFTLRAMGEVLRLKVNRSSYIERSRGDFSLIKEAVWYAGISKRRLLGDLDLVSSFLEEGAKAELHISSAGVEMCSHHAGIASYTSHEWPKLELLNRGGSWPVPENLSVPYVTSRHLLKVLEQESSDTVEISHDGSRLFFRFGGELGGLPLSFYSLCGDRTEGFISTLRAVTREAQIVGRIPSRHLLRILRRSLIVGRFSEVELRGEPGTVVVFAQHSGIAYRASIDVELDLAFSTRVRAYLLRSALNRLGTQNVLVSVRRDFVLFFTPSLTRFILLPNLSSGVTAQSTHRG